MSRRILICTDLDGTLIPDGRKSESPLARPRFSRVAERSEVILAFVTGRSEDLVKEAIEDFSLPQPDFVIADVGSSIFEVKAGAWRSWSSWHETLAHDWKEGTTDRLRSLLGGMEGIELQEESRQASFKLSYYLPAGASADGLVDEARRAIVGAGMKAQLIYSRDKSGTGLLDLVPPSAGKLSAVVTLLEELELARRDVVFAGDSGNDMPVLVSAVPSVLVANADPQVTRAARDGAEKSGNSAALYVARGGFLGMNGHYAGGVLEGLDYFVPGTREWMQ